MVSVRYERINVQYSIPHTIAYMSVCARASVLRNHVCLVDASIRSIKIQKCKYIYKIFAKLLLAFITRTRTHPNRINISLKNLHRWVVFTFSANKIKSNLLFYAIDASFIHVHYAITLYSVCTMYSSQMLYAVRWTPLLNSIGGYYYYWFCEKKTLDSYALNFTHTTHSLEKLYIISIN